MPKLFKLILIDLKDIYTEFGVILAAYVIRTNNVTGLTLIVIVTGHNSILMMAD